MLFVTLTLNTPHSTECIMFSIWEILTQDHTRVFMICFNAQHRTTTLPTCVKYFKTLD